MTQRVLQDTTMASLWLSVTENDLASRLRETADTEDVPSLVAWSGLRMDEVERIDSFLSAILGHALQSNSKPAAAACAVVDQFPATLLTSLVGRAARIASEATMWTDWAAALQLTGAGVEALVEHLQAKVRVWLAEFGLAAEVSLDGADHSDDAARLLLLNSGVQQSVVPYVLEQIEATAGLTESEAEISVAGVSDVAVPEVVSNFAGDVPGDVPRALRMLSQTAPEAAAQLVSGLAEFLIQTMESPVDWEIRSNEISSQLPLIHADAAREELRVRPAGTYQRRTALGAINTVGRPQLYFDQDTQRVGVQLPTPVAPQASSWLVTFGGSVESTPVVALGEADRRPIVDISEPVREVLVELGEQHRWQIPAIDTDDPIVIFGADGQSVTDKVSLHYDSAFVLFPEDATLVDPLTGDAVPFLTAPTESSWPLWQVAEVDLRDVWALQVRRQGVAGQVRSASPMRRPRVICPHSLLNGATTQFGTPVFAGGPVAVFPPTLSGHDEPWRVQLAEFTGFGEFTTEAIMEYDLEVPADGGEVEILTDDEFPWLGEFVVRLTNPRGRTFQRHFAVAEQAELDIAYRGGGDGFRIPTVEGLSPVQVRLFCGDKPMYAEPEVLKLGEDETKGYLELSTDEGASLEIQIRPATLGFDIPLEDGTTAHRRFTLETRVRRINVHGQFRVHAPGQLRHAHLSVSNDDRDICRVPLTRKGDVLVGDFGEYAERISMLTAIRINLDWTRVTARKRMSVRLVEAPRKDPVQAISWQSTEDRYFAVDVADSIAHVPLKLWIWCASAPWLEPIGLDVIDGECQLPEDYAEAGPYVVQATLGLEKGRRPKWPAEGSTILPALHEPDEDARDTGTIAVDQLTVPELARLWSLYAAMREGLAKKLAEANPNLAPDQLRVAFRKDARRSLAALNSTSIRLDDQPGTFIGSALVLEPFVARQNTPDPRRVPWLGVLSSMEDLRALPADDAANRDALLDYIRSTGGAALVDALATGQDTTLESASIDSSSVQITALPEAQANAILAQVFNSHRIVPGPLTDDDARFTAVYEVVEARNEIVDSAVMTGLASHSRKLFKIVTRTSPALRKAVNVRFHKLDGIDADDPRLHWTLTPGTSLLIAVAARCLAQQKRDNPGVDDTVIRELLPLWTKLADLVPTLVMSDLLIAEALVTHATAGDLVHLEAEEETSGTQESEA